MKKNIIKYFILPCFSMSLIVLFFPVSVFADSTYFEMGSGHLVYMSRSDLSYEVIIRNNSSDVRFVCLGELSSYNSSYGGKTLWFFSDAPFEFRQQEVGNTGTMFTSAYSYSGGFYYGQTSWTSGNYSLNGDIPYIQDNNYQSQHRGYYYTFGDGAVSPSPSYGNVKDVSFATDIAGNGDASGQNLDKIQWNNLQDSNGIDFPEGSTVTIRAVPGQYTGTSKENLLTKLYTDFVLDIAHATDLATVSASAGWYEITWQSVVSHFSWPFATVLSCLQGESYWYKNGWIYQIRLNIDDYHSEWQTIYNITSSGVENSETIINSTSITAISQSVNNINNINQTSNNYYVSNSSDTTNNYYYYDSPVNPDYSGNDVSGLFPSISEILNAIRNLPHTIGELLHNLFDELFEIDWEYDDFEQQKQYVIENSGAFGQCIGHLDDLKTLIMSYNTASGLAIIQWGDVVIDETVIVPAGMFNLGEIVAEDPMRSFYTLYQSLFSGFLYTLTFIKLYREALKALRQ